ncbi:MAG: MBL fold metallo-hydrolase [Bacillota bacterium]|nr:MBL fold metallo-hydrolase [Bacillota bacterium]
MKITNEIYMLEIPANIMGTSSIINPTLLRDNEKVILVDTGFPGQLSKIREAIENEGVAFYDLGMVILTHQDIDHVGNTSSIIKEIQNNVKVFTHKEEKPFIDGEKKPIKLAQFEAKLDYLPENMKEIYSKLKAGFESSKVNVDYTMTDGEELPYCGGILVIYTPGHTPGHISLYLKRYKTLIAGDLLQIHNGKLILAPESTNFDMNLTKMSLKKLLNYDIETVICYHGGIYKDDTNKRIAELGDLL